MKSLNMHQVPEVLNRYLSKSQKNNFQCFERYSKSFLEKLVFLYGLMQHIPVVTYHTRNEKYGTLDERAHKVA